MAHRKITHTERDEDGDILALCCPGASWSPRKLKDAIKDIEAGRHEYFVQRRRRRGHRVRRGLRGTVKIGVVNGPTMKYLRTYGDKRSGNNLDNLPVC
jgi:hypothetical protein